MHYEVMSVVLTIREVPEEVRDLLARDAREQGQSLQAFLLSVLRRQAAFSRNRQLLSEVEEDLRVGGGAGADAPDAAELLAQARDVHNAAAENPERRERDDRASA
jgi:antitoxin FitA